MSRDGWMKKRATASDDNGWAERGGYMAAKVSKLDEQFKLDAPREKHKDGTSSSIFSGVAIYVNGYTGLFVAVVIFLVWVALDLALQLYGWTLACPDLGGFQWWRPLWSQVG